MDKTEAAIKLCDLVDKLNESWHGFGQTSDIAITNDNITITGKEVIIKVPVEMIIRIPADRFEGENESVSPSCKSICKSSKSQ